MTTCLLKNPKSTQDACFPTRFAVDKLGEGGHNFDMAYHKAKRGSLVYLVAICFLVSLIGFVFPFFGEQISAKETIYFNPFATLFGGESATVSNGVYYGYTLTMNIPLVILLMIHIIGIFAALSSRNSPRLLAVTLIFAILTTVGLLASRYIFLAVNSSLVSGGLVFGTGFYISLISCLLCFAITVLELCLCVRFWKRRDAFR